MKVLTEAEIRSMIKRDQANELVVKTGTIITPSAREYLNEKKIQIKFSDGEQELLKKDIKSTQEIEEEKFIPKYVSKYSGGYFDKKPEEMTQLYGNELVFKNHPSIIFRGKLDSLQSKILELQVKADQNKSEKLVKDLQDVLQYVRNILKAEVIKQDIEEISLFGLKEEDLRKMSHFPMKYIGVEHILPDYKMGELVIGLNAIRSSVRETELSSIPLERKDIIMALNRLSSAVYVMMCRHLKGYYN